MPGKAIESTWPDKSNEATKSLSGTSQSSAIAAAVVLYLKALQNLPTAEETRKALMKLATRNIVGPGSVVTATTQLLKEPIVFPTLNFADVNTSSIDVSDRYVVVLKVGVDLTKHIGTVERLQIASVQGPKAYGGVTHQYQIPGFTAYAGHFSPGVIDQLQAHDEVMLVEKDTVVSPVGCLPVEDPPNCPEPQPEALHDEYTAIKAPKGQLEVQFNAPYHLNLISHREPGKDSGGYVYTRAPGEGTVAYIVDSGININHVEVKGRAFRGYNAAKTIPFDDIFGHGTHVAALVGGKTFGVAKACRLIDVKVFEKMSGSITAVLDGYTWAVNEIRRSNTMGKSVINMSLGGCFSCATNLAVNVAHLLGISTVVAAGNENKKSRWTANTIVVGATDRNRKRAPFSNWGPPVSLFAPGVQVMSAWAGRNDRTLAIASGTSQSSPIAAGVVLYLKGQHRLLNARVTKDALIRLATKNAVGDAHGSPNLFLYNGSGR
ncbi:hypothetical protein ANO11243_004020 [Dothideomycetidae sp. 11243]|nr:hypothetical protein ANO11243_004020 [fungal sp. No.11243]